MTKANITTLSGAIADGTRGTDGKIEPDFWTTFKTVSATFTAADIGKKSRD